MNIAVVGTGYVGLVTGTCLAETGNTVICVDINEEKVKKMKEGVVPIYEPHLDVLFHRNIKAGRLSFTTNLAEAIEKATIIFLALPTPPGEDGMNRASKPAYPSTCSFPVKLARCRCGYLPCQLGEYWYHTAGGSVDPQGRPSRT